MIRLAVLLTLMMMMWISPLRAQMPCEDDVTPRANVLRGLIQHALQNEMISLEELEMAFTQTPLANPFDLHSARCEEMAIRSAFARSLASLNSSLVEQVRRETLARIQADRERRGVLRNESAAGREATRALVIPKVMAEVLRPARAEGEDEPKYFWHHDSSGLLQMVELKPESIRYLDPEKGDLATVNLSLEQNSDRWRTLSTKRGDFILASVVEKPPPRLGVLRRMLNSRRKNYVVPPSEFLIRVENPLHPANNITISLGHLEPRDFALSEDLTGKLYLTVIHSLGIQVYERKDNEFLLMREIVGGPDFLGFMYSPTGLAEDQVVYASESQQVIVYRAILDAAPFAQWPRPERVSSPHYISSHWTKKGELLTAVAYYSDRLYTYRSHAGHTDAALVTYASSFNDNLRWYENGDSIALYFSYTYSWKDLVSVAEPSFITTATLHQFERQWSPIPNEIVIQGLSDGTGVLAFSKNGFLQSYTFPGYRPIPPLVPINVGSNLKTFATAKDSSYLIHNFEFATSVRVSDMQTGDMLFEHAYGHADFILPPARDAQNRLIIPVAERYQSPFNKLYFIKLTDPE